MDLAAKTRIRELEAALQAATNDVVRLTTQLNQRSVELAVLSHKGLVTGDTHQQDIDSYQATNTALITFIQKVADSQSKYAKEAKTLLGQ